MNGHVKVVLSEEFLHGALRLPEDVRVVGAERDLNGNIALELCGPDFPTGPMLVLQPTVRYTPDTGWRWDWGLTKGDEGTASQA